MRPDPIIISVKLDAREFLKDIHECRIKALFIALTNYRFRYGWHRFLMRDYWRTLFKWWFPATGTHRT